MTATTRESRLNETFVKLADTLVADYDVVELLHTLVEQSTELLDATAAGLVLANSSGDLEVVASTSERSRLVEVLQLDAGEGPCVECFVSGKVVTVTNVGDPDSRWPQFRAVALEQGYRSVHAVPLRLRNTVIGALNLFRVTEGSLDARDSEVAQALADVATIGILQERAISETSIVNEQLQRALTSRILIEQAKGVVSQTDGVDMDEAFARLRTHARRNNLRLRDVAEGVVQRSITV
ncbi:GAF and ANTAR domain-containing protein [Saxibacter everestensis]|uniref:GAF and ANTAR domain-containing protein n=1 Tax=Saxibacter everestensis TaxID=2909229 RepID=A0ABY8QTP7_9MICO|nr:GAF and ANTAR domain-containing protein [Brevibacteriaceae bacterium ZFBP1038]